MRKVYTPLAVAFHEAGHAFLCCETKTRFNVVTVVPNEKRLGGVATGGWEEIISSYNTGLLQQLDAERIVMILLAGGVAEAKHLGRPRALLPLPGGEQDLEIVNHILDPQCGGDGELQAYYRWLLCRTRSWVAYKWPVVQAIAKELNAQKTLSYRRVRKIWQSTAR